MFVAALLETGHLVEIVLIIIKYTIYFIDLDYDDT